MDWWHPVANEQMALKEIWKEQRRTNELLEKLVHHFIPPVTEEEEGEKEDGTKRRNKRTQSKRTGNDHISSSGDASTENA